MGKGSTLLILGVMIAVPVAARPVLQPFGGRAVLSYAASAVEDCDERVLLTLRNEGAAGVVYRLLWFDGAHDLVGRSDPRRLERNATVHLDVGDIARSRGVRWKEGTIELEWASERFSLLAASARLVQNHHHGWDFELVSPIPVDDEPPQPIRWAEYQAIAGR
jgi:hypothetical protein